MAELGLVDAHCHLDELARRGMDVAEAVSRAVEAGVVQLVTSTDSLVEARRGREIAERHPEVHFTPGWHPGNGRAPTVEEREELGELLRHPRAVALGEVGLDYAGRPGRPVPDRGLQREVLASMLELAAAARMPVVIHQREAQADLLELLDQGPPVPAMLHCFSGDAGFAAAAVGRGLLCSFAGNVTFRSARELQQAAAAIPVGQLLVETDAPFLAPEPHRGQLCHPALVAVTAAWLAARRGVCLETLAESTAAVARGFFGLPRP